MANGKDNACSDRRHKTLLFIDMPQSLVHHILRKNSTCIHAKKMEEAQNDTQYRNTGEYTGECSRWIPVR